MSLCADASRLPSPHHDSRRLLSTTNPAPQTRPDPLDKTYAVTPHRLRSQILVNNLKASGILPHDHADDAGRPEQLRHSARLLELIGFDENASMYSGYKGEGGRREWRDEGGKEEKKGGKRKFLKKLVGRGEEKGEKL